MQESGSSNGHKNAIERQGDLQGNLHPDPRIAVAEAEIELPESREPETPAEEPRKECISLGDFHAYMPTHTYIFEPTREMWPAKSVNARIAPIPITEASGHPVTDGHGEPKKIEASAWLDRHKPVEQMTWAPGKPALIRGRLIFDGG